MSSRRLLKAGEAIREVVSMAILTEIRDPRVKNVTVTGVEVAPDMREAKVSVSIMGNESQQKLTLRGLENSAGFLQAKIAKRIDTRYTPRLHFEIDDGVKKSIAVQEILQKIALERQKSEEALDAESSEHDEAEEDFEAQTEIHSETPSNRQSKEEKSQLDGPDQN